MTTRSLLSFTRVNVPWWKRMLCWLWHAWEERPMPRYVYAPVRGSDSFTLKVVYYKSVCQRCNRLGKTHAARVFARFAPGVSLQMPAGGLIEIGCVEVDK